MHQGTEHFVRKDGDTIVDTTAVQTSMCKSLRSIGLSPRKEHQLENHLVRQLRSSGPEFVLSRLSTLNEWRKMHMRGDTQYHPDWHAYRRTGTACVPTDPIGSQLWSLSDKAFFACIGSIRKSVELSIPTEKQLLKWKDGVKCQPVAQRKHLSHYPDSRLASVERSLNHLWDNRDWFSPEDLTATNIPGSGKFMMIRTHKDQTKSALGVVAAYEFSLRTAPLFTWQFIKDIQLPSRLAKHTGNPSDEQALEELIGSRLSSYALQDEAEQGSSLYSDEAWLDQGNLNRPVRFGFLHSVGNIGFLEQQGGKLRTVANPNRFVQYVNVPLGVAFQRHLMPDGSYVLDQHAGMLWAQSKLADGVSLSSFDMTAATDRLNAWSFIDDKFRSVPSFEERYPLLARSLDLFEDTSKSPWTVPGHVADLLGSKVNEVTWTVGQPLGLRPSFPLLTMMNCCFAQQAVRDVDGRYTAGHFACVGDDLVIESRYADAYMDWVREYNGAINNDKTMVSSRYAEFCSHMITPSTIYPTKPRFLMELEGSLQNVERFTTGGLSPRVPPWAKRLHDDLSSYFLPGSTAIPYSQSSVVQDVFRRIGVHSLIQAVQPASRDVEHVTLQTLVSRALQERERKGETPVYRLDSSFATHPYPAFGGKDKDIVISPQFERTVDREDQSLEIGHLPSQSATSVAVPVKKEWDYRSGKYQRPSNPVSTARTIKHKLDRIDVTSEDDVIEASISSKGVETRVLVDTRPTPPETLIVHRKDGHESVQQIPTPPAIETALRDAKASGKPLGVRPRVVPPAPPKGAAAKLKKIRAKLESDKAELEDKDDELSW